MIETTDDAGICQRADTLAQALWQHVTPLLLWGDYPAGRPKALASGVLVRSLDQVFIFSAAHVLAEFKDRVVWVLGSVGKVVPLRGTCRFQLTGSPDMGNHEGDRLDAAVLLIPPESLGSLNVPTVDVVRTEVVGTAETHYLLLAYPANRTRETKGAGRELSFERKPLICSEVPDGVYAQMDYDKRTHLLLEWRNEWRTATSKHRARKVSGSSGGGIWTIGTNAQGSPTQLVAIFIEQTHSFRGRRMFVGTRVAAHLALVAALCEAH